MFDKDNYSENQSQAAESSESAANTEKPVDQSTVGTSNVNAGSTGNNNANYDFQSYDNQSSGNQTNGSWQNGYQQNGYQQNGYQQGGPTYYNGSGQNSQHHGNYSGYGQYQSYQSNYQYGSGDYGRNTANSQNTQKHQKSSRDKSSGTPVWKKAVALVLSGVCFGVIAGVSFLAVNSIGGNKNAEAVQGTALVEEQSTEKETASAEKQIRTTTTDGTVTAVVTDVTEVVDKTMPSIVSITNQTITSVADFWGQTYEKEESSAGSGIIIGQNDTELLIVTNNHVVDGSDKLSVKFIDDEVVEALTKGTSSSMDLAVVAVKLEDIKESTMESISIATMGDSDSLKVGEPVIAIGNALGYGQSVTTGVVSALNRVLEMSETGTSNALIQTDAAINPGNSGGALLDINGNVIGINSNKIGGSTIEGMGYAIPISSAKPIIEDLMNRETRERVDTENRGYLGISCINVSASMAEAYGLPEGILIAQVYPDTGADNAGLVKGDVIVGFNGDEVTSQDDLLSAMEYYAVGDSVEVTVMRGNITDGYEEMDVTVTLTSQQAMNVENQ